MFIIENGYNTSYIISVIIGLFYKHNSLSELLCVDPIDSRYIYIQEFIKYRIIEPIKNNISILSGSINEFRNYINICGWSKNNNLLELRNIDDFYLYLTNGLSDIKLKFEKLNDTNVDIIQFDFINLSLNKDNNLYDLFKEWLSNKLNNHKYKLKDISPLITFSIKRDKNPYKIDIPYRIKFNGIDDIYQKYIYWNINSIICYNTEDKYYVIVYNNKKWLLFSDNKIPSCMEINIKDLKDKIMTECTSIFYTL